MPPRRTIPAPHFDSLSPAPPSDPPASPPAVSPELQPIPPSPASKQSPIPPPDPSDAEVQRQISELQRQISVLLRSTDPAAAAPAFDTVPTGPGSSPAPTAIPAIPIANPPTRPGPWLQTGPAERFSGGDRSEALPFIASMEAIFLINASHFTGDDDIRKVFLVRSNLLLGARRWFDHLHAASSPDLSSWFAFRIAFLRDWGTLEPPDVAYDELVGLRQVGALVNYNVEFHTLAQRVAAASSPLVPRHLISLYKAGLSDRLRRALDDIRQNRYGGFGAWPSLRVLKRAALDWDASHRSSLSSPPHAPAPPHHPPAPSRRLFAHALTESPLPVSPARNAPRARSPSASPPTPDLERQQRRATADAREAAGLCRYCGDPGHKVEACAALKRKESRGIDEPRGNIVSEKV